MSTEVRDWTKYEVVGFHSDCALVTVERIRGWWLWRREEYSLYPNGTVRFLLKELESTCVSPVIFCDDQQEYDRLNSLWDHFAGTFEPPPLVFVPRSALGWWAATHAVLVIEDAEDFSFVTTLVSHVGNVVQED